MKKELFRIAEIKDRLSVWKAGCCILYKEEIDSTNDWALREFAAGLKEEAVFVAEAQSRGRGRRGRSWNSLPGDSLTFSLLLRPKISPEAFAMMTPVMGLAAAETLREICRVDARIKWPNDIFISGRKVCGILAETDPAMKALVIGAGINICKRDWPAELSSITTTLEDENAVSLCREEILAVLLEKFGKYYELIEKDGSMKRLVQGYEALLTRKNERITVDGTVYIEKGIDEKGRLRVCTPGSIGETVLGGGEITNIPIGLAPLAGVTDAVFRSLCVEKGASFVCTEMVSAKAILYHNKNTEELMQIRDDEHPIAVQLFGSDPEAVYKAVKMIEDRPFDSIDFNMGCPVPKIVKNNEGSALMREPQKAEQVMKALVRAANKPVSIKIRSGFDAGSINAVEIAKIAQECGISRIAVHARTREQFYSGKADREVIRQVKEAVSIPVIGNGDVTDGPSAKQMLEQTGCDGVLIGRGAMGDPWIFSRIRSFLDTGIEFPKPSREEVFAMVLRHGAMLAEEYGETAGIRKMRSHAAWYTAGFPGAAALRREVNTVETLEDLQKLFDISRRRLPTL